MHDPLTYTLSGLGWSMLGFAMGWVTANGAMPRNPFKSTHKHD